MANSVAGAPIMDPHLWGSVGEELLEKIIARLPMKVLMQSQVLSKKWRSVFQSPLFQAEVSSVSSSWRAYYPLYVTEKTLMGYDRFSGRWQELFALPDFPEDFCRGFSGPSAWTLSLCGVTGALITLSYFSNHVLHTYICNPINKTVRRLPPLDMTKDGPLDPRFDEWDESVLLFPVSHYNYRVLVFSRSKEANVLLLRVYSSESNSWTEPKRGPQLPNDFQGFDSGAYLDKMFYFAFLKSVDECPCTLRSCLEDLMLFYAYDVDAGEFREVILPSPQQIPDMSIRACKLVACGTELLLVVWQGSPEQDEDQRQEAITAMRTTLALGIRPGNALEEIDENLVGALLYIPKYSFLIFRLDLGTMQLTEISRGPTENLISRTFTGLVVCDNDTIYLQTEATTGDTEFGIVMFDMRRQVWSTIPQDTENRDFHNVKLTEFAFQPGLNPFTAA